MVALAVVCLAHLAYPIDPNRMLSQYIRDYWGVEQGFTGGSVTSFAQTPDGYLWIGTEKGLIRFDGLNFQTFQQAIPESFPIGSVQGLVTDASGNLWVLLKSTRVLRFHDGKFELGREEAEFGITSVGRRADGSVLFTSLPLGVLTPRAGRFEILTSPLDRAPSEGTATTEIDDRSTRLSWATQLAPHRFAEPNTVVISMAETTDGKVWLGTQDKGLFYMKEGRVSAAGKGLSNSRINCLLALENRELWIGTDQGVVRWNGAEVISTGVPSALRHIQVLSMIRDHDSNIWVRTAGGLIRVNGNGVSVDGGSAWGKDTVTALFEDREGNLWIGSARGLERLRDSAFVTYSVAGLKSQSMGPLYVDAEDKTWFAPSEGGLRWLKGGKDGVVAAAGLSHDIVYSISSNGNHELWLGRQRGGLTHLSDVNGSIMTRTYTQADGLPQNGVYAVHQNSDGSVWSGTLSGGASEFKDGHFTTYTTANGLASNTVSSVAEGADGTMWFGTPKGLSAKTSRGWRTYTQRDGLPSSDVNTLLVDSVGALWVGTAAGLASLTGDHIRVPRGVPPSLEESILGMAEDRSGWLWITTAGHVLRVKRSGLTRDALSETDVREYGLEDGLSGTEGVKRYRSVVTDSRGNIWMSTNRGISVRNAARANVNSPPALIHIEAVLADGSPIDTGGLIRLPSNTQRTTFRYVGLSLANPERVQYRYKLEGFDHDWSEPTTNRNAIYGSLGAGPYRFRVTASNSEGLWNGSEATTRFVIEATLWQTLWFRVACSLTLVLALWLLYRIRMHQKIAQLNVRFEERLGERTRIAQDLHDTLLQGFLSASIHVHVATNRLSDDSAAKPLLIQVQQLMDQVINEGRTALQGLRSSSSDPRRLEQAFSRIPQELDDEQEVAYRVVVEGSAGPLHPVIRDEVYRIGREALVNAFRHAKAASIEIRVEYTAAYLRMSVRDDGCGIDPQVLQSGREGHWGLPGMRERAESIGAKLKVLSRSNAGTEVELIVPRKVAYQKQSGNGRLSWFKSHKD